MLQSILSRCLAAFTLCVLLGTLATGHSAFAQEQSSDGQLTVDGTTEGEDRLLRFAFDREQWRDVIKWLADECGLALHFEDLPTGSFSYSDPNAFSQAQAIDRVNLFLLPQGYTLVRSGKLLSVINLSDPRSMQQLDALADLVMANDLDDRNDQEVVKCLFPLGALKAEDAVQELSVVKLMTTAAVFKKTNQLMITDTVAKLKSVRTILDAFQPNALDNGTVVKSFALQYVNAEDILVVARPHLGLATGEMIGIDVSLSADLQGENIFVTGIEDKVKLIEGLIASIDRPQRSAAQSGSPSELRSHFVGGGNVQTVYSVLQTLLAGQSLRLSMDETAGTIVALATPEIQAEIAATVLELQASEAEFEVIPLRAADPYLVISLLEEMLDLPGASDDPDEIDRDAPKIDADPGNRRLFVRAKRNDIEHIKKIVAGLDIATHTGSETLRILPIRSQHAEQLLVTASKFWREVNPIYFFPTPQESEPERTERAVGQDVPRKAKFTAVSTSDVDFRVGRILSDNFDSQADAIRVQLTPRGLLLQSDDTAALDRFESHLQTIAGLGETTSSPPIVFYLKYTKPDDALRMLAELLDGGESAKEAEAGTLVNGYVSSSGPYLGSLVSSRDGMTTMMFGTITVVADSRLNRLIAQGTAADIERIEDYLRIIDKQNGIISAEVYGSSHVVALRYSRAEEVAQALREAYAGRVSATSGAGNSKQAGAAPVAPRETLQAKESEGGQDSKKSVARGASQPPRDLEPKMTIAIHVPSNSLIITAPDQLFEEAEQLALLIDSRSEQTVEVIAPLNAVLLESMLNPAGAARTKPSSGGASSSSARGPSTMRNASPSVLRSKSDL